MTNSGRSRGANFLCKIHCGPDWEEVSVPLGHWGSIPLTLYYLLDAPSPGTISSSIPFIKGLCFMYFILLLILLTSASLLDFWTLLWFSFLLSLNSQIISGKILTIIKELVIQFPCSQTKPEHTKNPTSANISCAGFKLTSPFSWFPDPWQGEFQKALNQ